MKKFFRFILLIINLLFVAALLLSTFAGAIPPSRIWWVSILSYGYFLLLLCNIVFVIIWLALSRWEFLISVAAIAVRYSFVALFFQIGGTLDVPPSDDTLKVMSFNTHGFSGLDSDTLMTCDSGIVLFLQMVDSEQPDVLCLQECVDGRKVKLHDSLESRGYLHHYGIHATNPQSPLILYSLHPLSRVHNIDKASKFYVDLRKNGHPVRVCCVHLDSYQLDNNDLQSFEQLRHAQVDDTSTKRLIDKFKETTLCHEQEWKEELQPLIAHTNMPLIIAGDFNDTPASYIYQNATRHLADPYVEQGRGLGTTYHGPYPAFRIDYLLHSLDIQALSYKRLKTHISDHYPVVVQFHLNPTQQ